MISSQSTAASIMHHFFSDLKCKPTMYWIDVLENKQIPKIINRKIPQSNERKMQR